MQTSESLTPSLFSSDKTPKEWTAKVSNGSSVKGAWRTTLLQSRREGCLDADGANEPSQEFVERKTVKNGNDSSFIRPKTRPSKWYLLRSGRPLTTFTSVKTCASSKYIKNKTSFLRRVLSESFVDALS